MSSGSERVVLVPLQNLRGLWALQGWELWYPLLSAPSQLCTCKEQRSCCSFSREEESY